MPEAHAYVRSNLENYTRLCYLTSAFAASVATLFAATSFMLVGAFKFVTFRAVVLKLVSSQETGKAMAVSALIQNVAQVVGRAASTRIYMATLATSCPWTSYVSFAALLSISVLIFWWMTSDMKRQRVNLDREEDRGDPVTSNLYQRP